MNKRVIIFDDDSDILEVTSVILGSRNYEVRGIEHLNDFLDEVLSYHPDVILMDLRIPEIGGAEAVRILKNTSSTKSIPVIIFTAHNNGKDQLISSTGADDVLFKPFNIKTLLKKIQGVTV